MPVIAKFQGFGFVAQPAQAADGRFQVPGERGLVSSSQIQTGTQHAVVVRRTPTLNSPLTAIIYGRHSRHGKKQTIEREEVRRVGEVAGHTVDVVIIGKGIQGETAIDPLGAKLAIERIGNLKVILISQAGVQPLVTLIVGHRIQAPLVGPGAVIPGHDLAHQPEIRFERMNEIVKLIQEIQVQTVGGIQAQAVDAKLLHPGADGSKEVIFYLRIVQIEFDQVIVPGPARVGKWIAIRAVVSKTQIMEPVTIRGGSQMLSYISKGPEIPANVIEDTIQNQAHALLVDL